MQVISYGDPYFSNGAANESYTMGRRSCPLDCGDCSNCRDFCRDFCRRDCDHCDDCRWDDCGPFCTCDEDDCEYYDPFE